MKKVSVIMSTYKTNPDYLFESINSILDQSYKNIELIIICDGSKDEYNNIINTFQDDRIRVFLNEENKGLPYSLNKAVELSSGDYIARMDSDDISLKKRIEEEVLFLDNHPDIYICGTNAILFGDVTGHKTTYFNKPDEIKCQILFKTTLIHPTVMIRREVFNEFKYNEEFSCSQDFELWSRISKKYNIKIININGIKYRIHNKQISSQKEMIQKELCKKIIHSNTLYISDGKDNSIIENTLWLLTGREKIKKENLSYMRKGIKNIISLDGIEKKFNKAVLKKVLYNRYFELSLKNKCFDFNSIPYYIRSYNIKELFIKIINH